ncbi:hypothetical protein FRC06_009811, partial [Ceratobasidium sp. 370]
NVIPQDMSKLISAVLCVLGYAPAMSSHESTRPGACTTDVYDEFMDSKHTTSVAEKSRTRPVGADSDVEEKYFLDHTDHKEVSGAGMVTTQTILVPSPHAFSRTEAQRVNRVDPYITMPRRQVVIYQAGKQYEEMFRHPEQDNCELHEIR